MLPYLLSRNILWIFSSNLRGNFALKNGGDFWWIFSGLRFPRNKARKLLKNFGENSEQNSGQNSGRKFEKFGDFSFCIFSDLTRCAIHYGYRAWTFPYWRALNLEEKATRLGTSFRSQSTKSVQHKFHESMEGSHCKSAMARPQARRAVSQHAVNQPRKRNVKIFLIMEVATSDMTSHWPLQGTSISPTLSKRTIWQKIIT